MASKGKNKQGKKSKNESKCHDIETHAYKGSAKDGPIYCGSCSRSVSDEDDAVVCDICEFWHHID